MTFGIFEQIERLIEYIPIDSNHHDKDDARFENGITIDSKFYFEDREGVATRLGIIGVSKGKTVVSFRDIIKLLNKFLPDAVVEELVIKEWYVRIQTIGGKSSELPLKSLLFDYCLAALAGDNFDSKLYLLHSLHFMGLRIQLNLILSVIANESSLREDVDVRLLLTLLARITEPNNIDKYFDLRSGGFNRRYDIYLREIQKLSPISAQVVRIP